MRRAGSTVQYQLTKELVEHTASGTALGWVEPEQFAALREHTARGDRLVVLKSHHYFGDAGDLLSNGRAKAVYVYRDVRDVVVSLMNKSGHGFWRVVSAGAVESVLGDYGDWTRQRGVLVSRYEDMVHDLAAEALRIAAHLGVSLAPADARSMAGRYALEAQKKRIRAFAEQGQGAGRGQSTFDAESLLHVDHIHSGHEGQWQGRLSPLQCGWIECLAYEWMLDRGYVPSQVSARSPWAPLVRALSGVLRRRVLVTGWLCHATKALSVGRS